MGGRLEYCVPTSIKEAVAVLAAQGDRACLLAGGTDLLDRLDDEWFRPGMVVDVNEIPELKVLQFDPADGLTVGAAVPWCRICTHPLVSACYPCLAMVAQLICSAAAEGRPTLGGSLCTMPVNSDSLPVLIALDASCDLIGPAGGRTVPAEELWTAPGRIALSRGEMLVSVRLPVPRPHTGVWCIPFYPGEQMEIVFVRAAASLALNDDCSTILGARVALGAAAPTPLFLDTIGAVLVGQAPSVAVLNAAAALARVAVWSAAAEGSSDVAQTAHAAGVLTRRVLQFALMRVKRGIQVDLS